MPSIALSVGLSALTGGVGTFTYIAQAAPQAGDLAPYVGGGAGVLAVGALVDVLRRVLNGSLIPLKVQEILHEQNAAIAVAAQREDRMMKAVEEYAKASKDSAGAVLQTAEELRVATARLAADLAKESSRQAEHMTEQVGSVARAAEDLRDELRQIRRGGAT